MSTRSLDLKNKLAREAGYHQAPPYSQLHYINLNRADSRLANVHLFTGVRASYYHYRAIRKIKRILDDLCTLRLLIAHAGGTYSSGRFDRLSWDATPQGFDILGVSTTIELLRRLKVVQFHVPPGRQRNNEATYVLAPACAADLLESHLRAISDGDLESDWMETLAKLVERYLQS